MPHGNDQNSSGTQVRGGHLSPLPETAQAQNLSLDLRRVVIALSDALDLVGVDDVQHGKRVGYMAMQCARAMGWSEDMQQQQFELGMLHDCGVSRTEVHRHIMRQFAWKGVSEHCETGYELLQSFAPLSHLAEPVRYHHTPWRELQSVDLPQQVAEQAGLVFLVDRVDSLAAPHYATNILLNVGDICRWVEQQGKNIFHPLLVQAFLTVADNHAFWLEMEPFHLNHFVESQSWRKGRVKLNMDQLIQLARIFSRIIDTKSPFTAEHSAGVARLSQRLGRLAGLPEARCDLLLIAGYFHDLGKLRVPDAVLEKPAPLSREERAIIEKHSFETYQILTRIPGLEEVARWAAFHHERTGGHGYPFNYQGEVLEREACIVAVADVFQALAQNRPYRKSLPLGQVLETLQQMAAGGQLDAELVNLVAQNEEACWQAAMHPEP